MFWERIDSEICPKRGGGGGTLGWGGVLDIMHGRGHMTIDARIPALPERRTALGFRRLGENIARCSKREGGCNLSRMLWYTVLCPDAFTYWGHPFRRVAAIYAEVYMHNTSRQQYRYTHHDIHCSLVRNADASHVLLLLT